MKTRSVVMSGVMAAAMVPFGFKLAHQWNPEFVFYSGVLLVEAAAVIWLDSRVRFSWWALGALGLWAVLHMAGGTVAIPEGVTEPGRPANLYNLRLHPALPKYDQVIHALGFGAATWAAAEAMDAIVRPARRGLGLFFALAFIGMGLGALNEVIEFIATRIMPETNVGGYDNTGWDLVCNMVGAIGAAAWWCGRKATSPRTAGRLEESEATVEHR